MAPPCHIRRNDVKPSKRVREVRSERISRRTLLRRDALTVRASLNHAAEKMAARDPSTSLRVCERIGKSAPSGGKHKHFQWLIFRKINSLTNSQDDRTEIRSRFSLLFHRSWIIGWVIIARPRDR